MLGNNLGVQCGVETAPCARSHDDLDGAGLGVAAEQQPGRAGQLGGLDHPAGAVGQTGPLGDDRAVP